mgnify:CR=1 FL=1|jgi:hypothetical protein
MSQSAHLGAEIALLRFQGEQLGVSKKRYNQKRIKWCKEMGKIKEASAIWRSKYMIMVQKSGLYGLLLASEIFLIFFCRRFCGIPKWSMARESREEGWCVR